MAGITNKGSVDMVIFASWELNLPPIKSRFINIGAINIVTNATTVETITAINLARLTNKIAFE